MHVYVCINMYGVMACISYESKGQNKSNPGYFRAIKPREKDHSKLFTCFPWSATRSVNVGNESGNREVKIHKGTL